MNREIRNQLAVAVATNVNLGGHPYEAAQSASMFLDMFEKFDDLHELRYELEVLRGTHKAVEESITSGSIRDVLPTVLTFQAMMKTGASSSLTINMLAKFSIVLKEIKSPAALNVDDAKKLVEYFAETAAKLQTEVTDLDREIQEKINAAKALQDKARAR